MANTVPKKKIAFISSYSPRKCGIATFASDLITNMSIASEGQIEPLVVAMKGTEEKYQDPVKFEIRKDVKKDYQCAADYINFSHVDAVSVQHEYGLFGGSCGSYLTLLLNRLNAPIITTMHTVLDDPKPDYFKATVELCNASNEIIVMNERGIEMLNEIYGVDKKKITLISHGIPDIPFVDNNYYKHKFGIEGRKTILTFGLLSKNKGIEVMLKAMPAIVEAEPSALYIVLGMTHPEIIKNDGESYRFSLMRMVEELEIDNHVMFHDHFVDAEQLHNFLCATDVYVTPYMSREQLTSGTLSFAVGAGKAVVSTPYWAAQELLSDGRGRLVKFGDHHELSESVIEIFKDESLYYSLRRKAYEYGRSRTWPKIGLSYWNMFQTTISNVQLSDMKLSSSTPPKRSDALPEPSLAHLKRMTDDTGLFQHAKYTIPNRKHGYCSDDNARAVIVMNQYYQQNPSKEALELFDRYLSFTMHSIDEEGKVRNFMDYGRQWMENEPLHDALGRTLWALGAVIANPPTLSYLPIIKDIFDRCVKHVQRLKPKGMAYAIIGMSEYLKQFPGASDIKREMELAADGLMMQFEENRYDDWPWFEDILTYDNAILPYALFLSAQVLSSKYLDIAKQSCDFLLYETFNGSYFSFVGCNGWYERGGEKAMFDQQPIEVLSTVLMLKAAFDITGEYEYLWLQKKAFDWFLGENDLHIPVYNFRTSGCHDGLMSGGVNANQGAESLLSFLQSLLCVLENYTIIEKKEAQEYLAKKGNTPTKVPKKKIGKISIKAVSRPKSTTKKGSTEPA